MVNWKLLLLGLSVRKITLKMCINQLVFGKNSNYPNNYENKLPALEGKTPTQIAAENLKAIHSARKGFIKNESSEKLTYFQPMLDVCRNQVVGFYYQNV